MDFGSKSASFQIQAGETVEGKFVFKTRDPGVVDIDYQIAIQGKSELNVVPIEFQVEVE